MDTYNGLFTTYSLEQFAIIWTMDVYYLEMKLYIYWKWIISTERSYDDDAINHWNSYLLHTSHGYQDSSSSDVAISDVCI